jgi:hypothetical protein
MKLFNWRTKKAKAADQAIVEKNQAVMAKEKAEKELQELKAENARKDFFAKQKAEKELQEEKAENARKDFLENQ